MSKLKLAMDELAVESFETVGAEAERGTVRALATFFQTGGCYSCDPSRCVETCGDTCDNSLDYCTCDDCTIAGPGCFRPSQRDTCTCPTQPV